jgi:hypothetical protein
LGGVGGGLKGSLLLIAEVSEQMVPSMCAGWVGGGGVGGGGVGGGGVGGGGVGGGGVGGGGVGGGGGERKVQAMNTDELEEREKERARARERERESELIENHTPYVVQGVRIILHTGSRASPVDRLRITSNRSIEFVGNDRARARRRRRQDAW